MDMDLDFHIEFPTPDQNLNSIDNGIINSEDETGDGVKKPCKIWPIPGYENKDGPTNGNGTNEKDVVVILLGWAGSQHKHLAKYSEIYLNRGCIVLRYITPVKALFVDCSKLPVLANRLVRLLKDMQLDSHPLFFHVFSNGGAFMYSHILGELAPMEEKFDIRGTIFDSCPAPRNLGKCFRAISNILADFMVFRYLVAAMVVVMLVAQVFWYHLKTAVKMCIFGEPLDDILLKPKHKDNIPLKDWLGRLCKVQKHSFLFLYSDADDLIPWNQVEKVADIVTSHGNKVQTKKFIGSEHVQHYRKYPEEYVDAVVQFIRQEMKREGEPIILWQGR